MLEIKQSTTIILGKVSIASLKEKAKKRACENRKLKKQLKVAIESKDHWKEKYLELKKIKFSKPKGHQYHTSLIRLSMDVHNHSQSSYRACAQIVSSSASLLGLEGRNPSASTIRNWVIKSGYYAYHQPLASDKWCIIIDESVSIGNEKLLLILGVHESNWKFQNPLTQADTRVLYVGVSESWKSEAIQKVLVGLSQKITISYCVSDKGNSIISAVKKSNLLQIYDCSHEFAHYMEMCYAKNEVFMELMSKISMVRKKWVLSKNAHLIPPKLRSKARFLNVFPLIEWVENIWGRWDLIPIEAQSELSFLNENRSHIEEWIILKAVVSEMSSFLKTKGMNSQTMASCKEILDSKCQVGGTKEFSKLLQNSWESQESLLAVEGSNYISCSDIIESYFGKYKQKIQGAHSITETILAMCTWNKEVNNDDIEKAFECTKIKDIKDWKEANTSQSHLQKKRQFFSEKCTKKAA